MGGNEASSGSDWDEWARVGAEALADGILVATTDGTICWANREAAWLLGRELVGLIGANLFAYLDEDELELATQGLGFLEATGGRVRPAVYHPLRADGARVPTEITATVADGPGGVPCLVVGARLAEHQEHLASGFARLTRGEPFGSVVEDTLADVEARWPGHWATLVLDDGDRRRVFGSAPDELAGVLVHDSADGVELPWAEAVREQRPVSVVAGSLPASARRIADRHEVVMVVSVPLVDPGTMSPVMVLLARRSAAVPLRAFWRSSPTTLVLSAAVQREWFVGRLREAAETDSLTGLVNRRAFFDRLDDTVGSGAPFALLYLDLDDFKPVNDRWGHSTGDRVLATIGKRLADVARDGDVVGRVGGDELVLLCRGVGDRAAATALAERVAATVATPICLSDRDEEVVVRTCVGVVVGDGLTDVDHLVERADAALYRAKAAGKGRVEVDEGC